MERKQLNSATLKAGPEGVVQAVFATLNEVDLDGDITLPGAFGRQRVKVSAYGHASWQGALPVGVGEIHESGREAIADLRFFMDTTHGRDAFATVKGLGDLGEWSYGFTIEEHGEPSEEQRRLGAKRLLKRLDVHEVSPVLRGAGVGTRTLSAKCDACAAKAGAKPSAEELERALLFRALPARELTDPFESFGDHQHDAGAKALAEFCISTAHALLHYQGVKAPRLRWFMPGAYGPTTKGMAYRDRRVVLLDTSLRGEELCEVVSHEVAHVAGYDEPAALAFGQLWKGALAAAFRWSNGQSWRVHVRDRVPPSDPELRRKGAIVISRERLAAYIYQPDSAGSSWRWVA